MSPRSLRCCALVALCVVAACATPANEDWRRIQRERLERALLDRPLLLALSETIRNAPTQGRTPQEPRHIDQREPQLPGTGPRSFRHRLQPLVIGVGYGFGRVDARVDDTLLDDRTAADFLRLTIDAGTGAALHADVWSSDDRLFAGTILNDGMAPAHAEASLIGVDVFPHYRLDTGHGAVRIGAFADWQRFEHDAGVEREYLSAGPRLAWEPSVELSGDAASGVQLFARLAVDVGATWFTEEYHGGDSRDATWRWAGDAAAGLRARFGRTQAEVGYRWRQTSIQSLDGGLYGHSDHTDLSSDQVFFGFALTY